jgi:hypothetical protein
MTGGPATSREELATKRGGPATKRGAWGLDLPGLATNRWRAGPTRRGVAAPALPGLAERGPKGLSARAPLGLATSPAAQAKLLPAPATTVVRLSGPEDLEGLVVPRGRSFEQPITRLAGRPGAVPRGPVGRLSARSGDPRVLAGCRKDFLGGVQDGLG